MHKGTKHKTQLDYTFGGVVLSIKIKISYIDDTEKRLMLKLLQPLLDAGYRYKIKKGKPRSLIYIQHKGLKEEITDIET